MKKVILTVLLLCFCSTLFNHAGGSDQQSEQPTWKVQSKQGEKEYDLRSILVKFKPAKPGAIKMQTESVSLSVNGSYQDNNQDGIDDRFSLIQNGRWVLMELHGEKGANLSADADLATIAINVLKKDPNVEYVEYNYKQYILEIPNDPQYKDLWGMKKIQAENAWDQTTGSSDLIVGVIDTGVDYTHQDLSANIWVNPNEIPNNGIDDEGNGYVDDIHGINAITGSGNPMDDHSHGTHCAGTIGAVGNNNIGVVGVNWVVKIAALKFLSSSGSGHSADAIKCINYAIDLKRNRNQNLRVLSNSWGGGGYSQALHDAISAANDADILFVAAAGNDRTNTDITPCYPSCYEVPNIISVAATDQNDQLCSFSNYGRQTVDLGAPGLSILSTVPNNNYASKSGTSMAAPHVSGAAALLLSLNSNLTVQNLKAYLMDSSDSVPALKDTTVSGNRLSCKGIHADMTDRLYLLSGNRIAVLPYRKLLVKEGGLSANWVEEAGNVDSFQLEGNRIGILQNGTLWVKEGGLSTNWVNEAGDVESFQLEGNRIGILQKNRKLLVKEGGLSTNWVEEAGNVDSFQLGGNRIGILQNGTLFVKEGGLSTNWVEEAGDVDSFQLGGNRIGILQNDTLFVKEGGLSTNWVNEYENVDSFQLEGSRIAAFTNGTLLVKEGGLSSTWVKEYENLH